MHHSVHVTQVLHQAIITLDAVLLNSCGFGDPYRVRSIVDVLRGACRPAATKVRVGVRSAPSCVMSALLHQNRAEIPPIVVSIKQCVCVRVSASVWVWLWLLGGCGCGCGAGVGVGVWVCQCVSVCVSAGGCGRVSRLVWVGWWVEVWDS